MPDFPSSAWKTLLSTPAPGTGPGKSVRLGNQKDANMAMWSAVDRNDLNDLRQAVSRGAALTNRRKGATSLWQTVANGQWSLAELLRAEGADIHTRTQTGLTLFDALAFRDQREEAERLKGWGCNPSQTTGEHFTQKQKAPHLLLWWIEQGNANKIPQPERSSGVKTPALTSIINWVQTGARGCEALRSHMSRAWGVRDWDPEHFAFAFGDVNDVAGPLWSLIFQRDDVEMARRCLASGWGPPTRSKNFPNMFLWQAAHLGAWNVADWFRQVPHFKKAMDDCARTEPRQWWRCATSLANLEKLVAYGVDFQQVDANASNVAHFVISTNSTRTSLPEWFARHKPDLLFQRNKDDATPLDMILMDALRARIESLLLAGQSSRPSARKTTPRL